MHCWIHWLTSEWCYPRIPAWCSHDLLGAANTMKISFEASNKNYSNIISYIFCIHAFNSWIAAAVVRKKNASWTNKIDDLGGKNWLFPVL